MRIAIITPGVFELPSPRSSSVERIVSEVAARLGQHADIYVLGRKQKLPSRQRLQGANYVRFRGPAGTPYWRRCARWIRRNHPQLVQVENRPKLASWLKRRFPRLRVWLNLHSTNFVLAPALDRKSRGRHLRRVDRVLFNSEYLREEVMGRIPRSCRKENSVLHPGVSAMRFPSRWEREGQALRAELRERHGYEGKQVVLFAGRLIEQKGVAPLLQAWRRVAASNPEAVLVIAGSARVGKNVLTDYVKALHRVGNDMPNHVRFISFVPYDEMPAWYCAADLVVVPSLRREAFGLVNVEAMACGTPVLASATGGIGEVVEDGSTGKLLPLPMQPEAWAEAIRGLLNDTEAAQAMGRTARARVLERFTWEKAAERYWNEYQRT